jgi:hypothetical protein
MSQFSGSWLERITHRLRPSFGRITAITEPAGFTHDQMLRMEFIVRSVRLWSGVTVLCLLLAAASFVHAQYLPEYPSLPSGTTPPHHTPKNRKVLDQYPPNPSLPPTFSIPAGPLGFSIPGENYFLRRQSLVSLDFLDENRILFTFRVSGLIERDADDKSEGGKQKIRAMVLTLPSGKIESQAEWIVPDRSRYLWMLKDGHFLLRGPDGLDEGDAELKMTPYLHLPGRLLWIQMDPGQQFMITNSRETQDAEQKPGEHSLPATDPPTATAVGKKGEQDVLVSRTIKRASGDVLHVSRFPWTSQASDWPMNSEGYLERSQDNGIKWLLKQNYYAGGDRVFAHVESRCPPEYSYVSESELLVSTCDPNGGWKLEAMSNHGDPLWQARSATNTMWPLLVMDSSGSRMARETLLLKRSADRYKHLLGASDIQGQMVRVLDAANGKMILEAPLTPMLDGGGNVAISPSGQRVAILNAGAIQIFQLPAPPPPPPTSK